MRIPEWARHIPHPTYGYYGGINAHCRKKEGCPIPVDQMDAYFMQHDRAFKDADNMLKEGLITKDMWLDKKYKADKELGKNLRRPLRPYKYKIYGPLYNFGAKRVFKP